MSNTDGTWSSWGWGLVSSVSNTTSRLVNDLAEAIEPEEDANAAPQTRKDDNNSQNPKKSNDSNSKSGEDLLADDEKGDSASEPKPKPKPKKSQDDSKSFQDDTEKIERVFGVPEAPSMEDIEADPMLKYIDSGVAFVGGSLEKLGSFLQKGVEKVQTTNMEDLTKKGSEMAQKSLAKLEAVGSTAIASIKEELKDVVGEQYGVPEDSDDTEGSADSREEKSNPSSSSSQSETKKKSEGSDEITFASAFEMANGSSHLKSLEGLQMHAMMTSQSLYATLDVTQRQLIAERMAKVSEIFKKDELAEEETKITFPLSEEFTARLEFFKLTLESSKQKSQQMEQIAQGLAQLESEGLEGLKGLKLAQRVYADAIHYSILMVYADAIHYAILIKSECAKVLAKLCVLALEFVSTFLDWLVKSERVDKLLFTTVYLRIICEKFESEIAEASSLFVEALKTLYNLSRALIGKTGTEEETAQLRKELQAKINNSRNAMLIDSGSSVAHLQTCKKTSLSVAKYLIFIAFRKREELAKQQLASAPSSPSPSPGTPSSNPSSQTPGSSSPAKNSEASSPSKPSDSSS